MPGPTVIVGRRERQVEVLWCSRQARQLGLRQGMTLAEARAIVPEAAVHEEDAEADRAAVMELARWAEQFTPLVGLEEGPAPSSLLLDVTGCAACFGGESQLVAAVQAGFTKQGWHVQVALADTVGAAWALAHFGRPLPYHCRPRESGFALLPLPVAGLRLPAPVLARLHQVGVTGIGQLAGLPPAALASRFGTEVCRRLDQALGRLAEPLTVHRPLPPIEVQQELEHPTSRREEVLMVMQFLLATAAEALRRRCRGARRLDCTLQLQEGGVVRLALELLRPGQLADRWLEMLKCKLEGLQLASAVRCCAVRVTCEEPMPETQEDLYAAGVLARAWDWAALAESLSHRLGREQVSVPRLVADLQPEQAYQLVPVTTALPPGGESVDWTVLRHRPLWLWPQPRPLMVLALTPPGTPLVVRTGGTDHRVRHAWGPERIETGWWRGLDVRRDYYVVEITTGVRWWIFRRLDDGRWFWHGCFD
jgi:protein ImuB